MKRRLTSLLLASCLCSAVGFGAEPRYVNARDIVISYQPINQMPVETARLWVRAGDETEWQSAETSSAGKNALLYRASRDGRYAFYLVLENAAGASGPPPTSETQPHLLVVADSTSPTLQIHRAARWDQPESQPGLRLVVTLMDENLGEQGARLFYRANADGGWVDAGPVVCQSGAIVWQPPANLPDTIDLQLVATDRAGNRAEDELQGVPVPRPASLVANSADTASPQPSEAVVVPLVEPVTLEPVQPVVLGENDPAARSESSDDDLLRKRREAEDLHRQAATFLAEGRYSLAASRLEGALELTPDEPDMLVDLGSAYYRRDQFDLADNQYRRALEITPDHVGALEGRALVAATQKRYPDARLQLEHLLELRPEAADHWLHFGDVEHMLGDRAAARVAWEKALQLKTADTFVRKEARKRLDTFQAK